MKIFLDDVRPTPKDFIRTKTVQTTIRLLFWNNGKVEVLSLDNDLGVGFEEGRHVARWVEEQAFLGNLLPIPKLVCHSDNTVAKDDMEKAFKNAQKFWAKNNKQ